MSVASEIAVIVHLNPFHGLSGTGGLFASSV